MAKKETKVKRIRFLDSDEPDWNGLFELLWEKSGDRGRFDVGPAYYPRDKVRLYKGEWELIKKLIAGPPRLPVTPRSVSFGFNVGLAIWGHRHEPFPGAVEEAPWLITLAPTHLPMYDFNTNRLSFNEVWDIISPLTHCDENVACLAANGFEPIKYKSYYDY